MSDFIGTYRHNLDNKFRASVPASFRKKIRVKYPSDELILVSNDEQCLFVYPKELWEKLIDYTKRQTLSPFNPDLIEFRRLLFSGAEQVEIDGQGRILLSAEQRQLVGIDKEIVIIGAGENFEIWSAERWMEYRKSRSKGAWELGARLFPHPDALGESENASAGVASGDPAGTGAERAE